MLLSLGVATASAAVTSFVLERWRRRRAHRPPLPLPLPGGPPADRAEAVRRLVKHLSRRHVAELTEGDAAVICGHARAIAPLLVAPFGGLACLGYHLCVRTGDVWSLPIFEDARCADFELHDDTGAIRVRATGIELAITRAIDRSFVRASSLPWLAAGARRRLTPVVEVQLGLLLPDAELLVCGVPAREPTPTDYRDGALTIELASTPTFPLVASPDRDLFKLSRRPIDPAELHAR